MFINKKMTLPQINNAIIGNESDQNAKEKEIAELDNTIMANKLCTVTVYRAMQK